MKKPDLFFLGFAIILIGILVGIISQNLAGKPAVSKTTSTSSSIDTEAIKKQLMTAGVPLHDAQYWRALPAQNP